MHTHFGSKVCVSLLYRVLCVFALSKNASSWFINYYYYYYNYIQLQRNTIIYYNNIIIIITGLTIAF